MSKTKSGFTLVELLIVIVVIGILAAITLVAYNGIQAKARDAKRAQDLSTIQTALMAYDALNGGVPSTTNYLPSGTTHSGWDASSDPNWLSFLRATNGSMPVDPMNTLTVGNNPPSTGNFVYYYYCYNPPSYPVHTVKIGYHKDDSTSVQQTFTVNACL